MAELIRWTAGVWWLVTVVLYLGTTGLALAFFRRRPAAAGPRPPVSLLVPVRGLDPELAVNLECFFAQDYPEFEVLVSAASAADPALAVVRRVAAAHPDVPSRILVGDVKLHRNPKVQNLMRSYAEARYDLVLMADCNVALPRDALSRMVGLFAPGIGLVSAVPIGVRPSNFVGELECAMVNGHGARWLAASAALGRPVAVGKILFLRRHELDRAGGLPATARHPCEDRAMEEALHSLGRRVACFDEAVPNPVGARRAADFWSRHVRYFWCRRAFNVVTFLIEPFTGGLVASLAAGAFWAGAFGLGAATLALGHFVAWLALEAIHLRLQGWPFSWRSPLAWALREFLLPLIWLRAVTTRTLVWQDSRFDAKVT